MQLHDLKQELELRQVVSKNGIASGARAGMRLNLNSGGHKNTYLTRN